MPVKATDKVFSLRLPIEIYDTLHQESKRNERSVNSEILLAIKKHLADIEKTKREATDNKNNNNAAAAAAD